MKRKHLLIAAGVLLVILQFIPVAPPITNPPVDQARSFDAVMKPPAPIAATLKRACADCHSHETKWPWYAHIAPVSWPIRHHVADGRKHLNLSEWLRPGETEYSDWSEFEGVCVTVREGSMPMPDYLRLHPEAQLTPEDKQALCAWVDATMTKGAR